MIQYVSFDKLGKQLAKRCKEDFKNTFGYECNDFLSEETDDWKDEINLAEEHGHFSMWLPNNHIRVYDLNVESVGGYDPMLFYSFPTENDDFQSDSSEMIDHINQLINYIEQKSKENYLADWNGWNSLSVEDWSNGYKNDIKSGDEIVNYIPPSDFNLYKGFKYDLDKCSIKELNFICKYLEEDKEYVNKMQRYSVHYLDTKNYDIEEIKEEVSSQELTI